MSKPEFRYLGPADREPTMMTVAELVQETIVFDVGDVIEYVRRERTYSDPPEPAKSRPRGLFALIFAEAGLLISDSDLERIVAAAAGAGVEIVPVRR